MATFIGCMHLSYPILSLFYSIILFCRVGRHAAAVDQFKKCFDELFRLAAENRLVVPAKLDNLGLSLTLLDV